MIPRVCLFRLVACQRASTPSWFLPQVLELTRLISIMTIASHSPFVSNFCVDLARNTLPGNRSCVTPIQSGFTEDWHLRIPERVFYEFAITEGHQYEAVIDVDRLTGQELFYIYVKRNGTVTTADYDFRYENLYGNHLLCWYTNLFLFPAMIPRACLSRLVACQRASTPLWF